MQILAPRWTYPLLLFCFFSMSMFPVKRQYIQEQDVCVCVSVLMGVWGEWVSEKKKGLCSRLLFPLPAVSPRQRASVRLCVIDRLAFSSMRIGSDLKQALPFLTECLSFLPARPHPPPPTLCRERVRRARSRVASGSRSQGHRSLAKG